jgi:hypothetical protein
MQHAAYIELMYCFVPIRRGRWGQDATPKHRLTFNGLHNFISQRTKLFLTMAVSASSPAGHKCSSRRCNVNPPVRSDVLLRTALRLIYSSAQTQTTQQ